MNLLRNQYAFQRQTKNNLSDILEMPYYKFEIFIEFLNEENEEKARQEKQMNDQYSKMQEDNNQYNGLKPAKMNIPKMSLPKYR